jgi:hypothetical protein
MKTETPSAPKGENMDDENATPRPWRYEHNTNRLEIKADTGEWSSMIAQVYKGGRCNGNSYRMPAEANAALIVKAVNAYQRIKDAISWKVATGDNVTDAEAKGWNSAMQWLIRLLDGETNKPSGS